MPLAAVQTRKIPATMPVASTDCVSMKIQNVMANQTVKFITDTIKTLSSRCRNVRSPWCDRSSTGAFGLLMTLPPCDVLVRYVQGTDSREAVNSSGPGGGPGSTAP